ncbi:nucleotidyltransferase domain-containing protein [Methanococcus voltae]|uniref:protein adenylyltransferase n=1 Tax=Methanococcus voltae (strain ATCC BAA-1334 / A3) TaxID=456320 RepID=D7DTJ1_METV3|nr:nucleotidyltransferase domain-containing protein [Methanococcus voltae]MCS3901303.1 putative nucleotidyltransferase [Methanococcus voltae]
MKAVDKIYWAYYNQKSGIGFEKNQVHYFSELRELTGLSHSSLQNSLSKMEKDGLIEKIKEKSNTYYKLTDNKFNYLKFISFDIDKFENLHRNVKMPLRKFIEECPKNIDFIILFGSASRMEEQRGSDIDLLVVISSFENLELQKLYDEEMRVLIEKAKKKANSKSMYPLSIFYTNYDNYAKYTNLDGIGGKYGNVDHVLEQAKKTGFPILGHQKYYGIF